MGKAVNWQDQVINSLIDCDVLVLNPRRDQWNLDLVQDISNPQFKEQVVWELEHLEIADLIVFYFDPNGTAPISLLELGLFIGKKIIVCCPPGYYRRGNLQIVCERYVYLKLIDTLDELIFEIKKGLNNETVDWPLSKGRE